MKILHLNIIRKWFDMIASGEKKEDYREDKPYWEVRLEKKDWEGKFLYFKTFDIVKFRNGYSKNAPIMEVEFDFTKRDYGLVKWGAEYRKVYYVIKLGKILKISNYENRKIYRQFNDN